MDIYREEKYRYRMKNRYIGTILIRIIINTNKWKKYFFINYERQRIFFVFNIY